MELHQLRYFGRVAELGNFTRAAEACHVSQPSLSQQIIKLEQELGQPLFERLGRQVRLTAAGRILKERVDQMFALLEDARSRIHDELDAGRLVVASIPTIAPYFLPGMLERFVTASPRAQIEVVEDVTAATIQRCLDGDVDLALVALPVDCAQLHVEPVLTEELQLVIPKGHALESKPRIAAKDLRDQPFVILNETHCLSRDALSFCQRKSFQPIVTSRMSQLLTVQQLVSLGQGVSLIPEMARRMDHDPTRVYRSLTGEKPTRTIALVWHQSRFQSRLFLRFVDELQAYAKRFAEAAE